jgi:ADP-heptose:LPS heptosyltransferase
VDKRRWERFLLTKFKGVFFKRLISPKVFGLEPQVERIINDFESIFCDNRGVRRTKEFVHGPHEEMTTLGALPEYKIAGDYVVLAPSASFVPKRWPIKSFVELAQKLLATTSYKIVVLAGPEDKFCEAFQEISSDRLINLQGKTSLKESMSILSRTKVCIGNDSGMNHIAEAHGVPCLTIFGPTDPRFGFAPHANKSHYLSQELWCKPCSTTGSKACFRDKLYCMEEISVDKVYETYLSMGVNS